ncbi:MAG TPA: GrpB family protein [Acidimicrobiales bacterium]|nr:GrpB family protein [Acidimicrobiales bacterium]
MIEVLEYNPAWPDRFDELRAIYASALETAAVPYLAIEHVGSTAVPGLAAKPVIDIDIVVETEWVESASSVLVSLGFEPRGEVGIPQRWAFWEPSPLAGTNTYVVEAGSLALKNHLALRDALRKDNALRDEYSRVKLAAGATAADIFDYGARKDETIQRILTRAGLTEDERASIAGNNVPRTDRRGSK